MTYLGHLHYYLGIELTQDLEYIFMSQKKYIGELFKRFGMVDSNPISNPMEHNLKLTSKEGKEFEDETKYWEVGGNLFYLTTTKPDI